MLDRHITPQLLEALADTPVVLINGARQTGKSTLAQSLREATPRRYLTLDEHTTLAAARSDPSGFITALAGPIAIDEIQRAPELFLAIKAAVDRNRQPGRFLLTGSANVMLLPALADSLAGRMEIVQLTPLSCAEQAGFPHFNRADWLFDGNIAAQPLPPCEREFFIDTLLAGGFPEAVARSTPRRREAWFDSYLQAVLQRDVRELAHLEQLTEMPNLVQLLAHRSASLLNFAELSRSSGLAQTTLKRYFTLLETLFLVQRIPAWERNPAKRLVKAPKIFLPDSGLLAHLCGHSAAALDAAQGLPGDLVETFVAAELLKHLAFSARGLSLWHYRTQTGVEVDFLLEDRQGRLTGIEVKAAASVDRKDFKGLKHLQETEPERFQRGIVLYTGRDIVPFGEKLFAVPMSMWWAQPR
ncbi:ATP-binding protein [Thauera sp. Sel9]|uniref:ATP-binding protein n=1 Tax=Thauera sp. Sel9 TaxID=2974299 RepID=UPI0021E1996B|nr:ATP-binding protein [Thauera sp. Sel9]MCV2219371.1 ATP-binding protein [Thauera sp. Sel9]